MPRFIVLVIDSYGLGVMDDIESRPEDRGANTYQHVFEANPSLRLPVLESLGLGNAADPSERFLKHQACSSYGISRLQHWGADTFLGHQEIMGTTPLPPLIRSFAHEIDGIEALLKKEGYSVRRHGANLAVLIVNEAAVIGDNLETDLGQNYNVTASFDAFPYQQTVRLGRLIRSRVHCNRVIAFGAPGVSFNKILDAYQELGGEYAGVSAPKSGVYKEGYRVLHLGYGINAEEQTPHILGEAGIPTVLVGKVADVVENHPIGSSFGELVDSNIIFDTAIEQIKRQNHGFFCINIQETDLAGHSQDASRYADILKICDARIKDILALLEDGDLFIITADHGNDPSIGHNKHTREKVPVLLYGKSFKGKYIGERASLSDIGASACAFFKAGRFPPNGASFL